MKLVKAALVGTLLTLGAGANASVITTANITANISNSNGAILSFNGFGTDYFDHGTHVSDWGFAVDGTSSTFSLANTYNATSGLLSFTGSSTTATSTTVTGNFGSYGSFARTTESIDGFDVLAINTSFTNTLGSAFTLLQFETFDPDQGIASGLGFNTRNDVVDTGLGFSAATSVNTAGLNPFFLASPDAAATEAGGVFQINSYSRLRDVLDTPVDGNGTTSDLGSHVVISYLIGAGETVNFTSYIGTTSGDLASALETLTDAIKDTDETTEASAPSALAIFGLAIAGLVARRRKI